MPSRCRDRPRTRHFAALQLQRVQRDAWPGRAKWNRRSANPACPGCLSPFGPGRRAQIVLRTILIRRLPQGSTNSSNRSVKFLMRSPPGVERLWPLRLFIQRLSTAEQRLEVRRHGVSCGAQSAANTTQPNRPTRNALLVSNLNFLAKIFVL
jgi:hypothetical protein